MVTETLYKPRGAGHSAPEDRRDYVQPSDELLEAFGKWNKWMSINYSNDRISKYPTTEIAADRSYNMACECMPDMRDVSAEEVNALINALEGIHDMTGAGIFLSAAYNLSDMRDIVFDTPSEKPVSYIGMKLEEGKRLVVLEDTGVLTGAWSSGTVLNYGNARSFGFFADGTSVNYGNLSGMARNASGLVMNFGECTHMLGNEAIGPVFNFGFADKCELTIGLLVNSGRMKECIKIRKADFYKNNRGADLHSIFIAPILPEGGDWTDTTLILEGDICKKVPGLLPYLDGLERDLGPDVPYQDVLEMLETLDVEADIRRILSDAIRGMEE